MMWIPLPTFGHGCDWGYCPIFSNTPGPGQKAQGPRVSFLFLTVDMLILDQVSLVIVYGIFFLVFQTHT